MERKRFCCSRELLAGFSCSLSATQLLFEQWGQWVGHTVIALNAVAKGLLRASLNIVKLQRRSAGTDGGAELREKCGGLEL